MTDHLDHLRDLGRLARVSVHVRHHREAAGLTQAALATRAGVGVDVVRALETGCCDPHNVIVLPSPAAAAAVLLSLGLDAKAARAFLGPLPWSSAVLAAMEDLCPACGAAGLRETAGHASRLPGA